MTVHNAERTLARQVSKLLDTLADLAGRFELLIVDDGSTDQTEEIAHELARDYPQLHVARQPNQLGADAAARIAVERTSGEVVILHEGNESPTDIRCGVCSTAGKPNMRRRRTQIARHHLPRRLAGPIDLA